MWRVGCDLYLKKKGVHYFKWARRKQLNSSCTKKKHSNTVLKKKKNYRETKVIKYCNLTDKECKIADVKKVTKCQENLKNKISEKNE